MASKSTTIVALLRQGWNEIPEVLSTGVGALFFVAAGMYAVHLYDKRGMENKRYKLLYTVMRPDDPRVAKVHKD